MEPKINLLFLCTGNSCRSQMAEGWTRNLKGDLIEVWSAGTETHGLNPSAVQAMAEAGIDISGHRSKLITDLPAIDFDWVITVCDHAREACPYFPGTVKRLHAGFDDPPALAEKETGQEAKMACYRRVRDQIRRFVETLPQALTRESS